MTRIVLTAALAALMAGPLAAQPFESKGEVEGWQIFFNEATGGCFMEQRQEQTVVHFGTEAAMLGEGEDLPFGFVALYVEGETETAPGDEIELVIDVDGQMFSGTGVGAVSGEFSGGYLVANNPGFAAALREGKVMNIAVASGNSVAVDLTGTMTAMEAARACQTEMSN